MKLSEDSERRIRRWALLLLVGVVPTLLLCIGVIHTILNHFFFHAPYLLDSGWYSDVVYRAGVSPDNPQIACTYAELYFGVHVSPYISVWSLLSYLSPLPRIEWYALFQAVVFLPFGIATYALASRVEPDRPWSRLPITVLAALAFTFSGQILRMIPYPHYEVAIASFDCLLLVMLVTGRMRWAWAFFVLALSVREDAGVHTALAIAPLIYLKWRGFESLPRMRTLLIMFGVGLVATVIGVICHKTVFHGASIMSAVYTGEPLYSHIDGETLARRVGLYLDQCQYMYYPFLATCLLAAVRRDVNYLLGWAVGIPWFALNFFAAQEQKAVFDSYSGFPYAVSIFWVFVYGAVLAPKARALRPIALELIFTGVCLTSTIGLYRANPHHFKFLVNELKQTYPMDRAAVHGFVDAVGKRRAELGILYVDYSVAALTLEHVRSIHNGWYPGVLGAETIAFHTETGVRDQLLPDVFANQLQTCTQIVKTGIMVCTRTPLPAATFAGLKTRVIPAMFALATLDRPGIGVDERGAITQRKAAIIDGWIGKLPKGTYELTWTVETDPDPAVIAGSGAPLLTAEILVGSEVRATTTVPMGSRELSLRFEASGDDVLWFRSGARIVSQLRLTHAQIRPIQVFP